MMTQLIVSVWMMYIGEAGISLPVLSILQSNSILRCKDECHNDSV